MTYLFIILSALLTGTPIGSSPSVNYSNNSASTTVNTPPCAFDGNLNTFYASYDRSYTWVGLDLGTPHVITRVGWSPRNDGNGPARTRLALFEGANRPDFLDALPLYLTDENGTIGVMSYADVTCNIPFRYVRYVGPNNARCNIAELAFYGDPAPSSLNSQPSTTYYRPTPLPCITIHTDGSQDPYDKETYIQGRVTFISPNGTIATDTLGIRLRGNASKDFPKKPYRLKLGSKQRVFSSPAKNKSWVLINNYGDKTLFRNILAMQISRIFGMRYTPWMIPVDVFVNGEYKGCYQLADKIDIASNRLDIPDGSYLWEIDAYSYDEDINFNSNHNNPVSVHTPDIDVITPAQRTDIRNIFNGVESALYGTNSTSTTSGWRARLDKESFLSHFLVGEFTGNTDTYWSVYQYKIPGDTLVYTGPVWDFDLAFENDNRTYPVNNKTDYIYRSGGSAAGNMKDFVNRIVVNDTGTRNELVTLWGNARHSGLTNDLLLAYIDSLASVMNASQRLNFMRWDILNQYVHQNPRTYGSYQGEVNNVRNYVTARIAWIDRKLGYTFTPLSTDSTSLPGTPYHKYNPFNLSDTSTLLDPPSSPTDPTNPTTPTDPDNQTTSLSSPSAPYSPFNEDQDTLPRVILLGSHLYVLLPNGTLTPLP